MKSQLVNMRGMKDQARKIITINSNEQLLFYGFTNVCVIFPAPGSTFTFDPRYFRYNSVS